MESVHLMGFHFTKDFLQLLEEHKHTLLREMWFLINSNGSSQCAIVV